MLLLGSVALASAQDRGEADVYMNGKEQSFSKVQRPYYWSGVLMLPLKETAKKAGLDYQEAQDFVRLSHRGNEAAYRIYQDTVELNGRTVRLSHPAEFRAGTLFAPQDLFEKVSGVTFFGSLRAPEGLPAPQVPTVSYLSRTIDYRGDERPFVVRGTLYVFLDKTARNTDSRVDRPSGTLRLRHGGDEALFEVGSTEVESGRRRWRLSSPVLQRGGRVFVPFELAQRVVGPELTIDGRR